MKTQMSLLVFISCPLFMELTMLFIQEAPLTGKGRTMQLHWIFIRNYDIFDAFVKGTWFAKCPALLRNSYSSLKILSSGNFLSTKL